MSELRILTFNVWGLAFVSKDRKPRLRAIAAYLAASDYDVVCLQEIWIHSEYERIAHEVRSTFEYTRFYHTGALGSGLAVFSRYPIVESHALPYSLSGSPMAVIAGDFFVNKAAARAVILHPQLGEVEIWTTHMYAAGESTELQQAHRMAEAWQLSTEIRRASDRWVFCMGDFNSQPYTIPIALLRSYGELRDSFLETHPNANESPHAGLTAESALEVHGITCDSPLNSYNRDKQFAPNVVAQGGKRLDYIFYRGPRSKTENTARVRCVRSEVVLTQLVPGKPYSYSDHFGLASTFSITGGSGSPQRTPPSSHAPVAGSSSRSRGGQSISDPLLDNESTVDGSESGSTYELDRAPSAGAAAGAIRAAHDTLVQYTGLAAKRATLYELISLACVVAAIGLAVGSAWQPKSWIQPIFTVVAFALGAGGATLLYVGFIWGRWERGLLDEATAEMSMRLRAMGARQ